MDDAAGIPEFDEGFELGVEGGVADAGPEFAVADEVTRGLNEVVGEGGEVDFDDCEGGGIPGGIVQGVNLTGILSYIDVGCGGFVFAGDVDEEGCQWARRGGDCFGRSFTPFRKPSQ